MAVETIKSRVLVREEKGIGSLTMKRLIFSSMVAGFVFSFSRLVVGGWAVPVFILTLIVTLYFTGERYGVHRYYYLAFYGYSRLVLAAVHHPSGWAAQLFRLLQREPEGVFINGAAVFRGGAVVEDDWSDWEIVADADHLDDGGLQIVADAGMIILNTEE